MGRSTQFCACGNRFLGGLDGSVLMCTRCGAAMKKEGKSPHLTR